MKRVFQILAVWLVAAVPACTKQTPVATDQNGKAPPKEMTNSIGMKLVLIPAGEFMMGSPESETEKPSSFWTSTTLRSFSDPPTPVS